MVKTAETSTSKYSPTDLVLSIYLSLSGIYIVISGLLGRLDGWWKFAIHHLVLLILIFAVSRIKTKKRNLLSFVRYLYPLFLYGSMYRETHEIDQAIFTKPLDYFFIVWDNLLFNSQPSVEFANYLNAPWFSEIMHFFYFSYFFLIVCLPLIYWIRKNPAMTERRTFDLSFTYVIFYSIFIILPVHGPRVEFPPAVDIPRTGFFFGPFFERLFIGLRIAGAAFPSSHCGIAALVTGLSIYDFKKFWPVIALCTLGVFLATVFGRFHYAVDVIYGGALGLLCLIFTGRIHSWLHRIGYKGVDSA